MNEPKSARYHRLDRRVACAALIGTAGVLVFLLVSGTSIVIRDLSAGSAAGYALVLWLVLQGVTLPASWYRGVYLERQFGLSRVSAVAWARDQGKAGLLTLVAAAAGAEVLYGTIRLFPSLWWVAAAGAGAVSAALLTTVAPLLLVALFHRSRPVTREALRHRLVDLARRAGVGVLGVHECGIGEDTARASAALVGAGRMRRILLSEALLTEYSDDEIEVVLAHEMGHHVHRDILQGLLARGGVLLAACLVAAAALNASWRGLGLDSTADVAGLPLILLVIGAVALAAAPALNALSRVHERRADRFALNLVSRPDAFVGAVRRMAARNLAEERPSRAALWLFHTHPSIEDRIRAASEPRDRSR